LKGGKKQNGGGKAKWGRRAKMVGKARGGRGEGARVKKMQEIGSFHFDASIYI
jgi:hypothetical protein